MAASKAEATRQRILDAALGEFSTHGVAGARVDRIAAAAGCNKNLLYVYFGGKQELFATVLERQLIPVLEATPFTPDDLAGYAGLVFDFSMDRPDLMRLAVWSTLEHATGHRTASHQEKIDAVATRGQDGRFTPAFVVTTVMALATAWSTALPYGLAAKPDPEPTRDALRSQVVDAVRLLLT